MSAPTTAQIKAVRKVLYNHAQLSAMAEDVQQINLLMNLDGPPLPQTDIRVEAGAGPEWRIRATGAIDDTVLLAVARCRMLAKRLQTMAAALGRLDIPQSDKQAFVTALTEQARTWTARAQLWSQPIPPGNTTAAVATITAHQAAADAALVRVKRYLRS